ncbi:MAG TPA: sigma 54-interacting transcriptional regulator [Acidobacteriaceae bacterium]|nr:sigma 54-interacting transcriptional regulator [Acidobacteriaceae bacterium]
MSADVGLKGVFAHSEALFRTLFLSFPDAIFVMTAHGRISAVSPVAAQMFGYEEQELLDQPIEALIPQRFRDRHVQNRQNYLATPGRRPMGSGLQLYGRRKDGSEVAVDIMLSPFVSDGEKFVLAVVRDITDRRKAEAALRESQERFQLLVEGARDYAIFMLDPEGKVITWNSGAERIKGYREDEIVGRHFSVFYPHEAVERGKPAHELELAAAEGKCEDEGWRIRKDGSRFWANVVITAIRRDGALIGFSKVTRDFTDRKRAEEALVLELSKAVLANPDIRQMLKAIEDSLQSLIPHDYAAIALYDSSAPHELHVQQLKPAGEARPLESVIRVQGRPEGWVLAQQEPLLLSQVENKSLSLMKHRPWSEFKSGCWVPLNYRGDIVGTLFVGRHEGELSRQEVDMLLQAGNQIANAIEMDHSFRRIVQLSSKLKEEKRYLEEELRTEYNFEEIVGENRSLRAVLKQVETVSSTDATVLILGETGTGKELIARSIHKLSPRRDRTFVKLNCSAIPLGLLESELFGHEKGAFTGAISQRIGRLELAHLGTLFLDEVGDLPLELQPKLLRALQEKEIERLGGRRTIPVDVRLIAATNRDLSKMVKEGQFRNDLYYRLRVFPITIPPLRERVSDIPLLVNYFVTKHARRMNKPIHTVPHDTMAALMAWPWPGNVRELENFIERAVILTPGTVLRAPLGELENPVGESGDGFDPNLLTAEREHILKVLKDCNGVIGGAGGAAEKLGLKRTTLNSKLKKLHIDRKDYA